MVLKFASPVVPDKNIFVGFVNEGRCIDKVNSYACVCAPGYSGVTCNEGERLVR